MKRLTRAGIVVVVVGLASCLKPEPVLYRVSLGMTEERLMKALGPPLAIHQEGEGKTFDYQTGANNLHGKPVYLHKWHVHLLGGKVDGYGSDDHKA